MDIKSALTEKVGPLPVGLWLVGIGGGIIYYYYSANKKAADSTPSTVYDTTGQSDVGTGEVGYANIPFTPGYVDQSATTTTITTNDEWRAAAQTYLFGQGYDAITVVNALQKYFSGSQLSANESMMISQAMKKLGALPSPLTNIPDLTPTPSPTPTPTPTPAPTPAPVTAAPAPAPQRTYTVRRGDNLSVIAQRYYGWQNWQKIYNANHGKIRNPNLIYPGQVLVIPN